jgi:transcriptional regulator with XRE-family HTH domain
MADQLGQRIEEARRTRGLSQAELADRAGLTRATVNRIEHGKVSPTIDSIQRIASVLGVSMDELFSGLTPPKASAGDEPPRHHYKFESSYVDNPDYREYLRALDTDALKREARTWQEKMQGAAGDFQNPQNIDMVTLNDGYDRLRMIEEALNELDPPVARITLRRGRPAEVQFYREPTPEELAKLNEEYPNHVIVDTRVQTHTGRNHD